MAASIEAGELASTRQSWRTRSVRDLLAEILTDKPKATENQLLKEYLERCSESEEDTKAALEYAFHNNYRALRKQLASEQEKASVAAAAAAQKAREAIRYAEAASRHAETVRNIKEQVMLLNLEMPNGKRLRHCTGLECAGFSGWFKALAKAGSKTIGQVYCEEDLRDLYKKHK